MTRRQAFEEGRVVRDEMERFRHEDRHLRAAVDGRIAQRSDLQHGWLSGSLYAPITSASDPKHNWEMDTRSPR